MNSETVNAMADYLARIDATWRVAAGYTGKPVHRRAYWRNMAALLINDAVSSLAKKKTL